MNLRRANKILLIPIVFIVIVATAVSFMAGWLHFTDRAAMKGEIIKSGNDLGVTEDSLTQKAQQYKKAVVQDILHERFVVSAKADFVGRWSDGMKIDSASSLISSQSFYSLPKTYDIEVGSWWRVLDDSCWTVDGQRLLLITTYDPHRPGDIKNCFSLPIWFDVVETADFDSYGKQLATSHTTTKVVTQAVSPSFPIPITPLTKVDNGDGSYRITLPANVIGNTGILIPPGGQYYIYADGLINVGSSGDLMDQWTDANGWLENYSFNDQRIGFTSYPRRNGSTPVWVGLLCYSFNPAQGWNGIGREGPIVNNGTDSATLYLAINDDFVDETGEPRKDYISNNLSGPNPNTGMGSTIGLDIELISM